MSGFGGEGSHYSEIETVKQRSIDNSLQGLIYWKWNLCLYFSRQTNYERVMEEQRGR